MISSSLYGIVIVQLRGELRHTRRRRRPNQPDSSSLTHLLRVIRPGMTAITHPRRVEQRTAASRLGARSCARVVLNASVLAAAAEDPGAFCDEEEEASAAAGALLAAAGMVGIARAGVRFESVTA